MVSGSWTLEHASPVRKLPDTNLTSRGEDNFANQQDTYRQKYEPISEGQKLRQRQITCWLLFLEYNWGVRVGNRGGVAYQVAGAVDGFLPS